LATIGYIVVGPAHSIKSISPTCWNLANKGEIMPKVTISDEKGLVQERGGGFSVTNTASLGNTLTATGAIKPGSGGLMQSAPVELAAADATTALTEAANAGRINVVPDVAGNSKVFTIPTPSAAGIYYGFVYGGAAADAHTFHFKLATTDGSVDIAGAIVHHDTNQEGQTTSTVFAGDGSDNFDAVELGLTRAMDLHFVAASTTQWYVWGTTSSHTVTTIATS
jgi:hypothetical protein